MSWSRLFIFPLLTLLNLSAYAQAPNNDIENAIALPVDRSYTSRTHNCTVQWNCVDESLTGKCIEYHNDQWFSFTPEQDIAKLYLNVYDQRCRDIKGVQVVVFTGSPCQTGTYQILNCTSLATQDDIFIPLTGLKANTKYWINIDGYLEDFCQFTLRLSATARGLAAEPENTVTLNSQQKGKKAQLDWQVDEEMLKRYQEIRLRQRKPGEARFTEIERYPLRFAHRQSQRRFTFSDTLNQQADYQLIGVDTAGLQYQIGYIQLKPVDIAPADDPDLIELPLDYKHNTELEIQVWNHLSGKLIKRRTLRFNKRNPTTYLNTLPYQQEGIRVIRVEVLNIKAKTKEQYIYQILE